MKSYEIHEEFQSVAFQGRVRNTIYDMSSGGLMQMDIFFLHKEMHDWYFISYIIYMVIYLYGIFYISTLCSHCVI